MEMMSRFTSENFLTLNESKCEVIICKKSSRSHLQSVLPMVTQLVNVVFQLILRKKPSALDMYGDQTYLPLDD